MKPLIIIYGSTGTGKSDVSAQKELRFLLALKTDHP